MRQVILCDTEGQTTGQCELLEAHESPGKLHRAFSVFVFRDAGRELLIQQRVGDKLFGSLWANSCCSHPRRDDEPVVDAARRRLAEECGFDVPLTEAGTFVYQAEDPGGRGAEHEHDTVLIGELSEDVTIQPAPNEVADWKWISVDELQGELRDDPARFAPWLGPGLDVALAARAAGH